MSDTSERTRRRPSLLAFAALFVALVYGGVAAYLLLSDGRLAGEPVVDLALAPEPAAVADKLLRTGANDDETAPPADTATPPAAAGTTPPDDTDTDKPSPDEQALLDAAKRVGADKSDDDQSGDAAGGDVKILGAESISGAQTGAGAVASALVALKPVPDPALVEQGRQGPLPIIAKNGRQPWKVYARPLPKGLPAGPRIALIVGGMGISDSATTHAIETLPPEVTLSFAPYGAHLQDWIRKARDAGHEVLLELPMEPFGYPQNDPGPYTLLTSLQPTDNIARLNWLLSRFAGYAGVMNYQGARFTSSPSALGPILTALKARGVMYVDNGASQRSLAPKLAEDAGLPFVLGTRLIDPVQNPDIIAQSLTALEAAAKQSGTAVGVATGFPVTVDAVTAWTQTLKDKGFVLVPATATAIAKAD
ncbi:MAG TPA: divergent polysaccharide deacetylase family protein [Parvibaculum sp.]